MIKCSDCGYENIEGLEYCDNCGAPLSHAASSTAHAAPAASATEAPASETHGAAAPASEAPTQQAALHSAEAPEAASPPPQEGAHAVEAPVKVSAKLRIVRGGRKGHEFELEEGNNLIGRFDPESGAFPEVDLEADDPEAKVSRKHAIIKVENGKVTIEDIGSLNGTYVNRGPRLQPGQPVELKNGDEIIVGKTFFQVIIEPVN